MFLWFPTSKFLGFIHFYGEIYFLWIQVSTSVHSNIGYLFTVFDWYGMKTCCTNPLFHTIHSKKKIIFFSSASMRFLSRLFYRHWKFEFSGRNICLDHVIIQRSSICQIFKRKSPKVKQKWNERLCNKMADASFVRCCKNE